MNKLRSGDEVIVITGKNKGSTGKIKKVFANDKVLVDGLNLVKKHVKPNPQLQIEGGIVDKEMPIHVSNVAILNPESGKADRVGIKVNEDGSKVRVFKSNGKEI